MPIEETKKVAVIDSSVNGLFIYSIPVEMQEDSEDFEYFLHQNGRKAENCTWGGFDGEINDLSNE